MPGRRRRSTTKSASTTRTTASAPRRRAAAKATKAVVEEMFRVLEPGGDFLAADIAPFGRNDAFRAVVLDWETENRGEPFMRSYLRLDLADLLREAGFVDVEAYGLGKGDYPWVVRGRKPAAQDGA